MKKIILILFIFFSFAAFSFGVDFGGYIENYSLIPSDSNLREQINKLAIWLEVTPSDTVFIAAQASVGYSYDEYDILADLDYLYLEQKFPGLFSEKSAFSYKIGRFFQSEFTGKVFAHRLDGALFTFAFPSVNITAGAGYTGLLLKPVSTLNNTIADMIDDADDDITFAPKKLIINLGASFPDIIENQQLDISAVGQLDLRSEDLIEDGDPDSKIGKGGKFNTFYVGLGLSGALTSSLIYDVYGYLQFGKSLSLIADESKYIDKTLIAFLAGGSISYLIKDFHFSKITASFLYASGDDDTISIYNGNTKDDNTQFMPVSESKTGVIFSPILSNLMKVGLEYSLKPFSSSTGIMKDFQAGISGALYFAASKGAVCEPRVSGTSTEKYLGTEALIILNYRPFSDFGITAAGGAFLPNTSSEGPMLDKYQEIQPGVMINASFSF